MFSKDHVSQDQNDVVLAEESLAKKHFPSSNCKRTMNLPTSVIDSLVAVPPEQEKAEEVFKPKRRPACHRIRKMVRALTNQERRLVKLMFFEGLTCAGVAQAMGMSKVAIVALVDATYEKLREGINNGGIKK